MIKVAMIGTGHISKQHLKALRASNEAELCAVCDINETVGNLVAEEYGVPFFKDYKDIPKNTDADAVIINLPHFLHCEVTEFFLNSGLHVLVEKPMANTVEECDRMIRAAEQNGKKLAVGHMHRFYPAIRKVREIYESKELGELSMVNELRTDVYFTESRPKWFLDKTLAGGGVFMNLGAHALDKLFFITGERAIKVSGSTGNLENDRNVEGHAQVHVELNNRVSANITIGGYSRGISEVTFYFTKGIVKVERAGTLLSQNLGAGWEDIELETANVFGSQLHEFCKLISGELCDIATGDYGRRIIEVIEQVYQ